MIVKVCGMRDPENIAALRTLDIDWIGMIFYDRSPRHVQESLEGVSFDGKYRVGVFVDESLDTIKSKIFQYGLNMIQLHGSESPEFCQQVRNLRMKVIKALAVAEKSDLAKASAYEGSVDYLLLDTKSHLRGGSGRQFDWSLLGNYTAGIPFLLSGGIGSDDAEEIRKINHPKMVGVDLNSRFESFPGLKDVERVESFVSRLRKTDEV